MYIKRRNLSASLRPVGLKPLGPANRYLYFISTTLIVYIFIHQNYVFLIQYITSDYGEDFYLSLGYSGINNVGMFNFIISVC